jgi:MFS family permease
VTLPNYFFLSPYMADWWGRKFPIAVGCTFMVLGGLLGAFSNGYGSKLLVFLLWL